MVTIDYEKYKNMSRESIFTQLRKEEKKLDNFSEKLKAQKELVKFLEKELKSRIGVKLKKNYTLETSPAIKEGMEYFYSLPKQEQEQIKNEVLAECGLLDENLNHK